MASNVIQQHRRRRLNQHNHHHHQQQHQGSHHHHHHHHHHHRRHCSKHQQQQQNKLLRSQAAAAETSSEDEAEPTTTTIFGKFNKFQTATADEFHYREQRVDRLKEPKSKIVNKNNNGLKKYFEETQIALGLRLCSYKLLQFGTAGLLLHLLLLLTNGYVVYGEGNVGCHFVRTLCLDGAEVCFDDNIFGKCIPTTGVDVEDIENTPLTEDQSRQLATMLEELQGAGLGWDHPYVQCRIQGQLFSLQRHTHLPPNLCANLAPIFDDQYDPTASSDGMAFVHFNPPQLEDYLDANEDSASHNLLYYPPMKKQHQQLQPPVSSGSVNTIFHELHLQDRRQQRHPQPQIPIEFLQFGGFDDRRMPPPQQDPVAESPEPNVMELFLERERARIQHEQAMREAEEQAQRKQALLNRLELFRQLSNQEDDEEPPEQRFEMPNWLQRKHPAPVLYMPTEDNDDYVDETNSEQHLMSAYNNKRMDNREPPPSEPEHRSFFREFAAEQGIKQEEPQVELQADAPQHANDDLVLDTDEEEAAAYMLGNSLLRNSLKPFEEEAVLSHSNSYPRKQHKASRMEHVYTEGGLLVLPEQPLQQQNADNDDDTDDEKENAEKAREILAMFGFTRRERLDVKKPGPLVGPPPPLDEQALKALKAAKSSNSSQNSNNKLEEGNKEVLPAHIKGSNEAHKKKKVVVEEHSDEDHAPHTVDNEYTTVFVKNPIDNWHDGVRIMNELANILHMQGYFAYLTVQSHRVSFRVNSSNPEHRTAADIARSINENRGVKNNILRRQGFTVLGAAVGDTVRDFGVDSGVTAAFAGKSPMESELTLLMFIVLAALLVAIFVVLIVMCIRKRALHEKVNQLKKGSGSGITGVESCSKDYQDLCRARMAGKSNAAEPVQGGRIMSLSKENERPPSSRSSTSSWSEEPALTNMDISTGHMVLSYMEDHLRNKGRLQREWEALCRYEAEPSARDAALQSQCSNFNRNGAPLPYDHSRVVLNHLANAEGLDYINASTITDHDPRAPAYVAAQGPLPATLAHFWQMIWEQGAVVIVALCRLQENGEIACARYWPEEGAEVYHIYEVHLVSEHIWCDDYLVRSFYLKNLRTSETRTVTQFHFLSWPQNGVPTQAKALLDFRRKVNKSYRGRSCPIVVHGSTGAGRTGAYILLDLVLGRMNKGAREIDIAATLEHLRDQRPGLVATRQQFEFVLMAVAEEVHAILKALPANQSNEKKEIEGQPVNGEKSSTSSTSGVLKEEEDDDELKDEAAPVASTSKASAKDSSKEKENAKDKNKEKEKQMEKTKATPKDKDRTNEKEKEQEKAREKEKEKDTAKSNAASNGSSGASKKK